MDKVQVLENDESTAVAVTDTDARGVPEPAHSITVIVDSLDTDGVRDSIATVIANKKSPGCDTGLGVNGAADPVSDQDSRLTGYSYRHNTSAVLTGGQIKRAAVGNLSWQIYANAQTRRYDALDAVVGNAPYAEIRDGSGDRVASGMLSSVTEDSTDLYTLAFDSDEYTSHQDLTANETGFALILSRGAVRHTVAHRGRNKTIRYRKAADERY